MLQLDLKLEAKNLLKFQDLMNGYENIKFPTPILPYVTNSVLVESFEVNYNNSFFFFFVGGTWLTLLHLPSVRDTDF